MSAHPHFVAPAGAPRRGGGDFVDEFLDELIPSSVDWRLLVRKYPRTCVAAAIAAGFWLGRSKSRLLLTAASSYITAQVGEAVVGLVDGGGE